MEKLDSPFFYGSSKRKVMTVVFINNSVYSFENPQIYLSMVFILDRFQNIIKLKSTQKKNAESPKRLGFEAIRSSFPIALGIWCHWRHHKTRFFMYFLINKSQIHLYLKYYPRAQSRLMTSHCLAKWSTKGSMFFAKVSESHTAMKNTVVFRREHVVCCQVVRKT